VELGPRCGVYGVLARRLTAELPQICRIGNSPQIRIGLLTTHLGRGSKDLVWKREI
jgi:hypothetical protein